MHTEYQTEALHFAALLEDEGWTCLVPEPARGGDSPDADRHGLPLPSPEPPRPVAASADGASPAGSRPE